MARSRVEGVTQLRRKLRRVDPAVTQELRGVLLNGLSSIAATEVALMPVDTGEMRNSVELQIARDGLTGVVGPAAKAAEIVRKRTGSTFGRVIATGKSKGKGLTLRISNKRKLMQYYKAYWLNFGTKGSAKRNIPAQPALNFVQKAYDANRSRLAERARSAVNNALRRAAGG
jgi:hypothetical protein